MSQKDDLKIRLLNDHTYHRPSPADGETMSQNRKAAYDLALQLVDSCPLGRELSLALTKIEEVVFWANAALARANPAEEPPKHTE